VRGTTSARIVNLLRDAGAKEIHMRVSAPPFLNPCYFGTDIDSRDKLIACQHPVDEIRQIIGADTLGYLSVGSVRMLADNTQGFCTACPATSGCCATAIPTAIATRIRTCTTCPATESCRWGISCCPRSTRANGVAICTRGSAATAAA